MNKILKILSILVIGFVMFSCANPSSNDDWSNVIIPPTDTTEETPEVPTYSIIFTTKDPYLQIYVDYLNTLSEFKNLKEGTEVVLLKHLYANNDETEITKEIVEASAFNVFFYYDSKPGIDSVVIGNEDVEVEVIYKAATDDLNEEDYNLSSLR